MSSKRRFKDNAEKRGPGSYSAMPHRVLNSQEWFDTSMKAKALITDLAGLYNGNNNGDLSLAWTVMKKRGWKSEHTLNNAKDELLERRWIIRTRKGSRNVCALYGLTFWGIDECIKYDPDIMPACHPRENWKTVNAPVDEVAVKRQEREKKQGVKIENATAYSAV